MRPDLVDKYVAEGAMPTYADLIAKGVKGANGMTQGFPPNTGVGWYTMATGTWPGEHGSTNNTYHRTGEANFNNRTSLGASRNAASRHARRCGRARRQEGRAGRLGRLARTPASPGRRSTSSTSSRPAVSCRRRSTRRSKPARPRSASPTRSRPSRPRPAGRTSRPVTTGGAAAADAVCSVATTFARAEPEPHLRRVPVRQRRRRCVGVRPHRARPLRRGEERAAGRGEPRRRRLPRDQAHRRRRADRRARRPDGGLLRQADHAGSAGSISLVQALLHVGRAGHRHVRRATRNVRENRW